MAGDDFPSNIEGGMLIDWDLSTIVDLNDEHRCARQDTRVVR